MESGKTLDARLRIGSMVIRHAIDYFQDNGFVQLLPVILGRSTDPLGPDPGSSIVKTPRVEYLGTTLYTMNSMILHKQIAIRKFDRLFILSPNVRLERRERSSTGRHLIEFTQLDFEMANAKMHDVMSMVEGFYSSLGKALGGSDGTMRLFDGLGIEPFEFKTPFQIHTTHELEGRYGKEWEIAASKDHAQPFWVTCHKREFYEKEDEDKPGHYRNYDLIYPLGYGEALSGGEREHEYGRITKRMGSDKLDMEVYRAYLSEAKSGLVPSAGAGFGIERLVRFLTRAEHVGDVQIFRRVPGENIVI